MIFQEKINELKTLILENLTPLIKNDYILIDLPYHSNIGDTLIWQGEESFLSTLPYKCLYRASSDTFNGKEFPKSITILLHGGGNFGDVWLKHQAFRKYIIDKYKDNQIIIFPQTLHYSDDVLLKEDAELISKHNNLTICARDKKSYNILKENFKSNILLLPDMAFCIDRELLNKYSKEAEDKVLLLKRNDKELSNEYDYEKEIGGKSKLEIYDWPSKQKGSWGHKIINKPIHPRNPLKKTSNYYAYNIYRPYLIKKGVRFLSEYEYIYSTRLHGAILSILLHKPFTFFDNSYGKNKSFFDAWLCNLDEVKFIED